MLYKRTFIPETRRKETPMNTCIETVPQEIPSNVCAGIIGAMDIEVNSIVAAMEHQASKNIGHLTFHTGLLQGRPCVVACCGEGKVNSALCAQMMLLFFRPACIINVGVAGGIGEGIEIGDLVAATDVVQHDFDVTGLGYAKGEIPTIRKVRIPSDPLLTEKILECAKAIYPGGLHKGTIASGDQFVCRPEDFLRIRDEFQALACEMEGASIGQVCVLYRTPFAVIRAISDNGNQDAPVDFPQFAKETAEKSQKLILSVLGTL